MDETDPPEPLAPDLAVLDRAEADLGGVDAALRRLDAGTYGVCEHCGGRIDDGLLVAAPTAARCRACG